MEEIQAAAQKKIDQHGGVRKAARALRMTPAYLSRLRSGNKQNPSDKILRKLGLRRSIKFESRPPRDSET